MFKVANDFCYSCESWNGVRTPATPVSPTNKVYALLIESRDANGMCMNSKINSLKKAFETCRHFKKPKNFA